MKRGLRWMVLLVLVLACFAGCRKQKRERVGEPPQPLPTPIDAAVVQAPPPGDDAGDCVAECVKKNQMRAVSAEQIELDCKSGCANSP